MTLHAMPDRYGICKPDIRSYDAFFLFREIHGDTRDDRINENAEDAGGPVMRQPNGQRFS